MAHYKWIARVLFCLLGPTWASDTQALVPSDDPRFTVGESVDEFDVIENRTSGYYYDARYNSNGNHARADTACASTEMLQTAVVIAGKVESSALGLAHRDSTQGDGEIEAVADRGDHVEAIDNSQGKKRRVFVGVSIESGVSTLSAAKGRDYEYSYGPIAGWSLEIGSDPFAIELGREKIFNRTPTEKIPVVHSLGSSATIRETGMYVSFIRLKRRIIRLNQLHAWLGVGIDHSITKSKWIDVDDRRRYWIRTNEWGGHVQGLFLVKKWRSSDLSFNIRCRYVGDLSAHPANYVAPDSHETRAISVKWTYFLIGAPC